MLAPVPAVRESAVRVPVFVVRAPVSVVRDLGIAPTDAVGRAVVDVAWIAAVFVSIYLCQCSRAN